MSWMGIYHYILILFLKGEGKKKNQDSKKNWSNDAIVFHSLNLYTKWSE